MKLRHIIFYGLFLWCQLMYCQSIDDKWKQEIGSIVSSAQNAWNGVINFGKGFVQSFGYVSPDYKYSFRVWNDAPKGILVVLQQIVGLLGAEFYGTITDRLAMGTLSNSGDYFYNKQLYITIWICYDKGKDELQRYAKSAQEGALWGGAAGAVAGFGIASPVTGALGAAVGGIIGSFVTTDELKKYAIFDRDIYPWVANDPYVYHYRAYSNRGQVAAEYLDIKGTTSEFLGTFYNNTQANDITLTFSKDGKSYTVTLEADSFSLLQSSSSVPYSIRPSTLQGDSRAFIFKKSGQDIGFMPLAPEGIANVECDDNTKKCTSIAPMNYTYEVYLANNNYAVGLQGLAIGNFTQPTNGKVRDINPVECHFWYESAEQARKRQTAEQQDKKINLDSIPFDVTETLWLYYKTKDYSFIQKVLPGSVINFNLIRPQLSEKEAWLYAVLLDSNDMQKALQFLNRLNEGKIAEKAFVPMTAEKLEAGAITVSPNINGVIPDTGKGGSGLTGYIVLGDKFTSRGVGFDTFYYYLEPAQLQIDQFASSILFDNKYYAKNDQGVIAPNDVIMQELATKIPQWIRDYPKNKPGVQQEISKYLAEKGEPTLFGPSAQTTQKSFGNLAKVILDTFVAGPISIANPPLIRKAGVNYYTFALGARPENWPA